MSADNGIYILESPCTDGRGSEYRVAHLMAVDNVDHPDGLPTTRAKNAREMWPAEPVFYDEDSALSYAAKWLHRLDVCEYGISFITIDEPWKKP